MSRTVSDAFYDRGITFPINCFLNNGAPSPKIVGMPILFRKLRLSFARAIGLLIEMQLDVCRSQFSGDLLLVWISYVRSLRKFKVNLYRRTPRLWCDVLSRDGFIGGHTSCQDSPGVCQGFLCSHVVRGAWPVPSGASSSLPGSVIIDTR